MSFRRLTVRTVHSIYRRCVVEVLVPENEAVRGITTSDRQPPHLRRHGVLDLAGVHDPSILPISVTTLEFILNWPGRGLGRRAGDWKQRRLRCWVGCGRRHRRLGIRRLRRHGTTAIDGVHRHPFRTTTFLRWCPFTDLVTFGRVGLPAVLVQVGVVRAPTLRACARRRDASKMRGFYQREMRITYE